MRRRLILLLAIALPTGFRADEARAHGGGILVQQHDGQLVTGFDGELGSSRTIGRRAFSLLFPPTTLAVDVPSFLSLAAAPADSEPLPQGTPLHFDLLPMTIDGVTSNLFYWDGLGDGPEQVSFGPVSQQDVTMTLYDPDFVPIAADGSGRMIPGSLVGVTSTSSDNLRLHAHRYYLLDDGDDDETTTPPDGIYLMALQLRMEGLRASDPLYIASAGFQNPTPAVVEALDSAALPWVEQRVDALILDGDYDFNGAVEGRDFLLWQRHHGSDGPFPVDEVYADGDGDGVVNGADVAVWETHFGAAGGAAASGGQPVPEPSTLLLWALAACAGLGRFQYRRQTPILRLK